MSSDKGKVTLQLEYPFDFGDEKFTELTFSRLKAKHMASFPTKPTFNDLLKLISVSTGLLPAQVNELDASDTMAAIDVVNDFLGVGAPTIEA